MDRKWSGWGHFNKLKRQLKMNMRKLYVLREVCPLKVVKLVYYALLDSILSYGLAWWGRGTSTIKSIILAQKYLERTMAMKCRIESS